MWLEYNRYLFGLLNIDLVHSLISLVVVTTILQLITFFALQLIILSRYHSNNLAINTVRNWPASTQSAIGNDISNSFKISIAS
jgi:hypothetical protein